MSVALKKGLYPGKVAIRHAVESARSLKLDVGRIRLLPDGSIEITDARFVKEAGDTFEQWEQAGLL